jgi:hypothetical protein
MRLEHIKYHTCPYDQEEGILLTDLEEVLPETDEDGHLQYYCMSGQHTFAADDDDNYEGDYTNLRSRVQYGTGGEASTARDRFKLTRLNATWYYYYALS